MATISELNTLDSAKYLYLREISESRDNSLRLVVQEAVANPAGIIHVPNDALPEVAELLTDYAPIESTVDCRVFELIWNRCIAYLVTEECVGSCGNYDDESFNGRLFRVYTRSHFLEHLARDTGGHTEAILHFKLTCLNHLIDVAAYAQPEVRLLGPFSSTTIRVQ
jgi:hypothetical protein